MFDFPTFEKYLSNFDFPHLFIDVLGWNNPPATYKKWECDTVKDIVLSYRAIAELGGIFVIQIVADADWLDESQRLRVWKYISQRHNENLLIFTNTKAQDATQSLWYWVKRDNQNKQKLISRRHDYFKGQPVDLFASKLQAMVVELSELDSSGRLSVLEAARRIASALDVEKTTQKFFKAYQQQHLALIEHIHGIDDPRDKRWYASVLLNRLMFVWFMQKKGFLQDQNGSQRFNYLHEQLEKSERSGINHFYGEFLAALFFEAFAKPESDRTPESIQLTGKIPYLNGGLFLPHKLELDANNNLRLGKTLHIADIAFKGIFDLFASFTWHLDDTPNGAADEINPDVLGYIFEKYINQKAFGAYYTRPEITSYLADRSIHKLILERINEPAIPELGFKEIRFDSVPDLLAQMKPRTALRLVNEVLPKISILDPSVGSGAFLVAALKSLIQIYSAVVGRAEMKMSTDLVTWLEDIKKNHASVAYYIKRRIVTDNLYGVDIMEEACEIAKLRLFLSMVASVRRVEDLEPLPNIDFNILSGNSLVGLMRVDEVEFNTKQNDLFKPRYGELVIEKNRHLDAYRHAADIVGKSFNLRELRDNIDHAMRDANTVMNGLLRDQLETAGVKFEQATWDSAKNKLGKPQKRQLLDSDIAAQTPFHWGYVFDDIIQKRGGFDIVLANPPWEVLKPQAKEFFAEYSGLVSKNKMTIKEFEKEQSTLLKNSEVREAWLAYESRFPHLSSWFRAAPEFKHQSAVVNGKKTGSDINLYKLFVERSFHLLRAGGHCGIVIPSGIYTDLGAKGLRDLLFSETKIEGLFCFENKKEIFEGVHRSFKFVVLTFEKGDETHHFPAAFMRHDVEELARFPKEGALELDVNLIRRLSPDSHSVMEFKSALDVQIAEKMLQFPLLGEKIEGVWNLSLTREFDMTNDSHLFKTEAGVGRLPLFEGKMIWQFDSAYAKPKYWVDETEGRKNILGRKADDGQLLDYQAYRLGLRSVASNTNERSLVVSALPKFCFCGNSLQVSEALPSKSVCFIIGLLNSYLVDWILRIKVTTNINMFYVYQLPVPRLTESDPRFTPIVQRAAKLICTTPEFDDLAKAVGLKNHHDGATDPTERAQLRAELDGLIAHLYGLTEHEFSHIVGTFPLVKEAVKTAALEAYRGNL
jgi:hypothetical protein